MGLVHIPDNKSIENTNLETHVALSLARNGALEDRIQRAEKKISDMEEQAIAIKRIMFAAIMSALFGVVGTAITFLTGIR